jgi:hypothetical protein
MAMMKYLRCVSATLLVLCSTAAWGAEAPKGGAAAAPAAAPKPADAEAIALEKAVAAMRGVKPEGMSPEQQKLKALELSAAWKTLTEAGKPGTEALKAEIRKVDAAGAKDDFFRLGAGAILWQIGRLGEAETVAALWKAADSLTVHYNYVFFTAMEAAQTQDPRVIPMLTALLRQKGSVALPEHALNVDWTGVNAFVWGAYGPKGEPVLQKILETSADPVALEAATLLLATAQYLPALPAIRKLAAEGKEAVRTRAIWCLGTFGHPQDFDFLIKGLESKDPKAAFDYVYALYDYEDLRAAAAMVPMLASPDERLRDEVRACLEHLLTPLSLEALHKHAAAPADATDSRKRSAQDAGAFVERVLQQWHLDWAGYAAKSDKEKDALIAGLRAKAEERYVLKKDDRRLTHEDLLKAAEEWKRTNRITGGSYEWVEDRHALAASTPADINLWLEVKAKVLPRLSDECLAEARILDDIVRRLGRSRYRKEPGLTEKVELPAVPAKGN